MEAFRTTGQLSGGYTRAREAGPFADANPIAAGGFRVTALGTPIPPDDPTGSDEGSGG